MIELPAKSASKSPKRPKILIVADSPHWAFAKIQMGIIDSLKNHYDFYWDYTFCHHYLTIDFKENYLHDVFYRFKHNTKAFLFPSKVKRCVWKRATLTPFWKRKFKHENQEFSRRVLHPWKQYDAVILLDYYFDRVSRIKFKTKALAKGIYTSTFPPLGMQIDYLAHNSDPFNPIPAKHDFFLKYLHNADAIILGAPELEKYYGGFGVPTFFGPGIVEEYSKLRKSRHSKIKKPLKIGWMGNPKRAEKHYWDIVYPVVQEFVSEGDVHFYPRFSGPRETLPDYIEGIDIFISASESDVGPFMFNEGALYGVPCISTKHGHAALVIEHGVNGWFIECTQSSLRQVLKDILENLPLVVSAQSRIRNDFLKKFNKESSTQEWNQIFQFLIQKGSVEKN
jgi:glycosyltransferase involved in cell wall biosynthesis